MNDSRSRLVAGLIALLLTGAPASRAVDGRWTGATSNAAPAANYSNAANWGGGVVADGLDASAVFDYNPVSDAGGAGQLAGAIIFDVSRALGHLVFNDRDGFGGATIGLNNPATPQILTLATTFGAPSVVGGQLLNSQVNGKKVVINPILAGTQGLVYEGTAHTSLRGSGTITGRLDLRGGSLELQRAYAFSSAAISGANLQFGFNHTANTAVSGDLLGVSPPISMGGPAGGGTIFNSSNKSTSPASHVNHSQTFSSTDLQAGYNWIQANTGGNGSFTTNMVYNLGAVSFGPGSALNLAKPAAAGTGAFNLSNTNDPTGIISARLLFQGTNWAINNGSGAAAAFAAYQANVYGPGIHTSVTASQDLLGVTDAETLRMDNGHGLALSFGDPLTLKAGGILSRQNSNRLIGPALTSALSGGDGTNDLVVHASSGGNAAGLWLDCRVVNDNATPVRLVKGLTGNLTLSMENGYSGGTVLGGGNTFVGIGPFGGANGSLGSGPVVLGQICTSGGQHAPNGQLSFNRAGVYTVPNRINPDGNGGGFLAQYAPGVLVLDRAARVGGFIAQAGTTRLDFAGSSAPASQMLDSQFSAFTNTLHTARLILRQGGLEMVGAAGVTNVQSFALTDLRGGAEISLQPDAAAGSAVEMDLGSITRNNNTTDGYGLLAIQAKGVGTAVRAHTGAAGALLQDGGVAYATFNDNDWAAKDATNAFIVPGASLGGFYTPTTNGITVATANYDYNGDPNVSAVIQAASLRFTTGGTVTLGAAAQLRAGGLLVTPAASGDITIAGAGSLAANNTGNRDLPIFHHGTGTLIVTAPVSNHSAGNITSIIKTGTGVVDLQGASTSTGRLVAHEGKLRLSGGAVWGTSAARANNLHVRGGEIELAGSASVQIGAFASVGQIAGNQGALTLRDNAVLNCNADCNVADISSAGTVELRDNATLTTKNYFVGKFGWAWGIHRQSGGALYAGNAPSADWILGGNGAEDIACRGRIEISGGVFDSGNQNFQIGRNGMGEVEQTGGQMTGTGFAVLGRFHSSAGTWNLSGGVADYTRTVSPGITGAAKEYFIVAETGRGLMRVSGGGTLVARSLSLAHNGGRGQLTISGGLVDLTETATLANGIQPGVVFGAGTGGTPALALPGGAAGTVVLSGGTLRAAGLSERAGSVVESSVVFNGGTWQARMNNPIAMAGIDRLLVSDGGVVIDTAGFNIGMPGYFQQDPDRVGPSDGGLRKRGAGVLTLTYPDHTFTGEVRIEQGALALASVFTNTLRQASAVVVHPGATLDPSGLAGATFHPASGQTLAGGGTVTGSVVMDPGSTLSPGMSVGVLTTGSLAFRGGSQLAAELDVFTNLCDRVAVAGNLAFTNGVTLALSVLGLGDPAPGVKFALFSYTGAWNGGVLEDSSGASIPDDSLITVRGITFRVNYNDTTDGVNPGQFVTLTVEASQTPYEAWIQSFGVLPPLDHMLADADSDGELNVVEFALNGVPDSAAPNPRRLADVSSIFTNGFLFTTVPVRDGAVFSGSPVLASAPIDGIRYFVEGSEDLAGWPVPIVESGVLFTNGLPAADSGWSYRTFRFAQPLSHPRPRGYLRVGAEPAP